MLISIKIHSEVNRNVSFNISILIILSDVQQRDVI